MFLNLPNTTIKMLSNEQRYEILTYPKQGARSGFALPLGIPIQYEARILVDLHPLGKVISKFLMIRFLDFQCSLIEYSVIQEQTVKIINFHPIITNLDLN